MDHIHPEFERLVIENAKLKASLKAADYEKQKMLQLIQNLLAEMNCSPGINENNPDHRMENNQLRDSTDHAQPSYSLTR